MGHILLRGHREALHASTKLCNNHPVAIHRFALVVPSWFPSCHFGRIDIRDPIERMPVVLLGIETILAKIVLLADLTLVSVALDRVHSASIARHAFVATWNYLHLRDQPRPMLLLREINR